MTLIGEVKRLPALRTVIAYFAPARMSNEAFYDAVCEKLRRNGVPVSEFPDDADVYRESWKHVVTPKGQRRAVRCAADDPDGYAVVAIDLKKWSRGRKPKEQRKS